MTYDYDANGNMTTRGTQTLIWDAANRLQYVDVGGVRIATYTYDAAGMRVKKEASGETTIYVGRYYEKNLTTGVETLYLYLGDQLVAYKVDTNLRYLHRDHLGSTAVVTDGNGDVIFERTYDAWGNVRTSSGTADTNRLYTGQRFDAATGLYYYNARYYDLTIGRFISPDGIVPDAGDPQVWNRYSYVQNNPLTFTDPSGRCPSVSNAGAIDWFPEDEDGNRNYDLYDCTIEDFFGWHHTWLESTWAVMAGNAGEIGRWNIQNIISRLRASWQWGLLRDFGLNPTPPGFGPGCFWTGRNDWSCPLPDPPAQQAPEPPQPSGGNATEQFYASLGSAATCAIPGGWAWRVSGLLGGGAGNVVSFGMLDQTDTLGAMTNLASTVARVASVAPGYGQGICLFASAPSVLVSGTRAVISWLD